MKWNVKNKILLIMGLPLLIVVILSLNLYLEKSKVVNELNKLKKLSILSEKISNYVHETQKERGRTAGFLGSKG